MASPDRLDNMSDLLNHASPPVVFFDQQLTGYFGPGNFVDVNNGNGTSGQDLEITCSIRQNPLSQSSGSPPPSSPIILDRDFRKIWFTMSEQLPIVQLQSELRQFRESQSCQDYFLVLIVIGGFDHTFPMFPSSGYPQSIDDFTRSQQMRDYRVAVELGLASPSTPPTDLADQPFSPINCDSQLSENHDSMHALYALLHDILNNLAHFKYGEAAMRTLAHQTPPKISGIFLERPKRTSLDTNAGVVVLSRRKELLPNVDENNDKRHRMDRAIRQLRSHLCSPF
ncbi:hypothetical protein F5X96DRAFT_218723 [Biscogniauxia mediterranea]|nr:hypothetical protein F5X96DRAFT_218723 [Biscogniauxia mediterranea]